MRKPPKATLMKPLRKQALLANNRGDDLSWDGRSDDQANGWSGKKRSHAMNDKHQGRLQRAIDLD